MVLRPKTPADSEDLVGLAFEVHRRDGYPRHLPDDLAEFMTPDYEDAAWVADMNGQLVGHVALHRATGDPTLPAAQRATGLGPNSLAVLARLVVAPAARRQGVARELIAIATQHACSRGQRLVLDVVQDCDAAVGLYEDLGWVRVEPLKLPVSHDHPLDLWVYVSPGPEMTGGP